MAAALVALFVGTSLGFLSGLGTGGGSLLIVYLTGVLGMEPAVARMMNLLFFLPSALVASALHLRQRQLTLGPAVPAIIAGCIAAALGTWLSASLDMVLLQKLFGGLLLVTGVRELLYRPRNAR